MVGWERGKKWKRGKKKFLVVEVKKKKKSKKTQKTSSLYLMSAYNKRNLNG